MSDMSIVNVPIRDVKTPFQFRSKDSEALSKESIQQLAEEMRINGVWDLAIPARKRGEKYEAACGTRRLRALNLLKIKTVRLDVKERSDEEMERIAAAENTARRQFSQDELRAIVAKFRDHGNAELGKLLGLKEKYISEIRSAIRALGEMQVKPKKGAKSGAIARAKSLGKGAQKRVAEQALSERDVQKAKDALQEVRSSQGNVAYEKCREQIAEGKLGLDPEKIKKAGKKSQREFNQKLKRKEKTKKKPPGLEEWVLRWSGELLGTANFFSKSLLDHPESKAFFTHINQFPSIAKDFRKSIGRLRGILEKIEDRLPK